MKEHKKRVQYKLRGMLALAAVLSASNALSGCGSGEPLPVDANGGTGGQDAGAGDTAGGPDGSVDDVAGEVISKCGVTYEEAECTACMDERCCALANDYAMVPDGAAYDACVRACPGDGYADCAMSCDVSYPEGMVVARPLAACRSRECGAPCGISQEASCGFQLLDQTCHTCAKERCCDLGYRAFDDLDDWAMVACLNACGPMDAACANACLGEYPIAYAQYAVFLSCLEIECVDACEGVVGGRFPCGEWWSQEACQSCSDEACCEKSKEAALSEDPWAFLACAWPCAGNASCEADCQLRYIEGAAQFYVAKSCIATSCHDPCSYLNLHPCGNIRTTTSSCNTCMNQSCCEEWTRIGATLEAQEYLLCRGVCDGQQYSQFREACVTQCAATYPDGYVLEQLSLVCEWDHCPSECLLTAPPACLLSFPEESSCGPCVEASCCQEARECAWDHDCQRIHLCRYLNTCAPDDTACLDACKAEGPAGVPVFEAYHGCIAEHCGGECLGW